MFILTTSWVLDGNMDWHAWVTSSNVIRPVKLENWVKVDTILSSLRGTSISNAREARKYLIELYPELEEILWENLWEDDQVKADTIIMSFFEEFSWVDSVLTNQKNAVRETIKNWAKEESVKLYEREYWIWSFTAWTSPMQLKFLWIFSTKLYSLSWNSGGWLK